MIAKQWKKRLGLLPALGLAVGCGAAGETENPVDTPVEARSVDAAAVTAGCANVTQYQNSAVFPRNDTHVVQASPGTGYGSEKRLVSDGSPRQDVYLTFGIYDPENIVRARLLMYATDGSTDGPAVYATGTNWSEYSLTWNSRPAPTGAALANVGAITSGSWVEYDLTDAVKSTGYELGLVLVPDSGDGVDFVSRNDDAQMELQPRLLVTRAVNTCTYQGTGGAFQGGWHKGGTGNELAQALATDGTGASVVAGIYGGSGSLGGATFPNPGGLMLGRFRADGTHEWSRAYPQPAADLTVTGVTLTPLGNVLIVGWYTGTPDFGTGPLPTASIWTANTFIAKFSPNGSLTWVKGFTASTPDEEEMDPAPIIPTAVATDANGSLIVTGYFFGYADLGGGLIDAGPDSRSGSENNAGLFIAKFNWEGHHVFSRAYEAGYEPTVGWSVAADSQGNVLLGGEVSTDETFYGRASPFVAKFSPTGEELWFRLLDGAVGSVMGVAALPGDAVAFAGHFGGDFTFAGQTVHNTDEELPHWDSEDLMMGVLEASGTDRWALGRGTAQSSESLWKLAVDAQGNFTLLGGIRGPTDLGGGTLGPNEPTRFVARYTADGAYRWARTLDPNLDAKLLGGLPGGATLVGGSFHGTVQVESTQFGPSRGHDVLLLKLAP